MKAIGGVIATIGGIVVVVVIVWGALGFYISQVPVMLILLAVGGLFAFVGGRMVRGDGSAELTPGAGAVAATETPFPSDPGDASDPSEPLAGTTIPATVDLGETPERLAELAFTNPDLWPAIEGHPNAYPGLQAWIAEQRRVPDLDPDPFPDDEARASDPDTAPEVLAEIAYRRADLRPAVAANPAAYDGLREWIAEYG